MNASVAVAPCTPLHLGPLTAGDLERPSSGLASHDFWNAHRSLNLTRATSIDAAGTWVLSGRAVARFALGATTRTRSAAH